MPEYSPSWSRAEEYLSDEPEKMVSMRKMMRLRFNRRAGNNPVENKIL